MQLAVFREPLGRDPYDFKAELQLAGVVLLVDLDHPLLVRLCGIGFEIWRFGTGWTWFGLGCRASREDVANYSETHIIHLR